MLAVLLVVGFLFAAHHYDIVVFLFCSDGVSYKCDFGWMIKPRPFWNKAFVTINQHRFLPGSRGRACHDRSNNSFWLHFLLNWWKHPLFNRNLISSRHTSLAYVHAHCLSVDYTVCVCPCKRQECMSNAEMWQMLKNNKASSISAKQDK